MGKFNEQEYREKLIARGLSADTAQDVARKYAEVQRASQVKTPKPHQAAKAIDDLVTGMALDSASGKNGKTPTKKNENSTSKKASLTSVGQKTKKPGSKLTKAELALVDASTQIMGKPAAGNDLAFNHGILCQVGLPRSKVSGDSFLRRSGDAWVHVQAGVLDEGKGPVQQTIPYGPLPRLALAWVSTYAVRHNTAEIPIGDSAAEFLRLMGMDDQGARYKTLRTQMHALASCRLQMGFKGRTYNAQPVEQFDAWINDKDNDQRPLWPGALRLSDSFFNILMERPVPLDNRALLALKGSALALDIYCWLAHRLRRIEGRPIILYWHSLREQFAQEYTGKNPDKDFKAAFLPQLHKVLMVYPTAKVKQVRGGLLLMPSPPPVPPKI